MDELARADDGSWRIDLVAVAADGPLPTHPGRRRLLTVLDGPVLGLEVDGGTQVVEPQRPYDVAADAVAASVPEGPVRVLDVVVDPAAVSPYVTVLELGRGSTLPLADDQLAYVLKGEGADGLVSGPGEVAGRCTVAVVTLERVS
ncbi:HutD family protein [Nocardioides sp. SYSU D00065]|uniref:HutD family protein n=1 Tax=Nocardioides sp. SYSU D00065 TaxID=2817378 RepID=UPI001B31FFC3|nr:HutD family protein [Nocardioides sp. SYSU D00065]